MINSFVRSLPKIFTIGSGVTGSVVTPVSFKAPYKAVLVECTNADGIDASTDLTAQVGYNEGGTMVDLYEQDDPGTIWTASTIPATGTFGFILTHAFGVWRVRFILSKVSTADVVLTIRGLDRGE